MAKIQTNLRLTEETRRLLKALSEKLDRPRYIVLEDLVRDAAKAHKIK